MKPRTIIASILFAVAVIGLGGASVLALVLFSSSISLSTSASNGCNNTIGIVAPQVSTGSNIKAAGLDPEQLKVAQTIISIGQARGRSARDVEIALMVAMQESGMRNISYGDRDSLGIYQQRPSAGWGTPAQILDPVYAVNKFYAALEKVAGRDTMPLLEVAIAVQQPSRAAYTSPTHSFMSWEGTANQLLTGFVSNGATAAPMVYNGVCNQQPNNAGANNTGSWRKPLDTLEISSPWGMRLHPILNVWKLHDGVDFVAPTGTPIYSISAGRITTIASNSAIGNYVTVDYGGGILVTYEHMSRFGGFPVGASVAPGDTLGYVGATGYATGAHLHLSWVQDGQNINPVPELCKRGISVPGPQGCAAFSSS